MGRTNPTYRDSLRRFADDWAAFRRGLRRRHQDDFDDLLERADRFADAASYQNPTDPARAVLLSMLLAHEVEQRRLRERVRELEASIDANEGAGPAAANEGAVQADVDEDAVQD